MRLLNMKNKDTKINRFIRLHCAANGIKFSQCAELIPMSVNALYNICYENARVADKVEARIAEILHLDAQQASIFHTLVVGINTQHEAQRKANLQAKRKLIQEAKDIVASVPKTHVMTHGYLYKLFEANLHKFSDRQVQALGTTIKCFVN